METIATNAEFLVVFIWESIHESLCRHGLMESRVEYADLRHAGNEFRNGFDACDVGRVVERSHRIALFHPLNHFGSDEH